MKLLSFIIPLSIGQALADDYKLDLPSNITRPWAGAQLWSNPMEDWQLKDGKLQNTHSGGDRNISILAAEILPNKKDFVAKMKISQLGKKLSKQGIVGFQIGKRGRFGDYRDTAIYGKAVSIGIKADGTLFIGRSNKQAAKVSVALTDLQLELTAAFKENSYSLTLNVKDTSGKTIATHTEANVHPGWVKGGVGMLASALNPIDRNLSKPAPKTFRGVRQTRRNDFRFAFSDFELSGDAVKVRNDRNFGPIMWTQQTLTSNGSLKLLALMAPVGNGNRKVSLEIDGKIVATEEIETYSRTATFNAKVNPDKDHKYAVIYKQANGKEARFEGEVRQSPKGNVKMAAMSCNDSTGFPHNDLVTNVTAHKPDFVSFLGDQIYEPIGGYGLVGDRDNDRATLSYLRKYYMHGWSWRELLADIPSVTIPDDHDVFHGNIWGNGGRLANVKKYGFIGCQDFGGYKMDATFVNAVHTTQTGNLPTGPDPRPNPSGISNYYTSFVYGGVDFAIIADRQYKSSSRLMLPEAKIKNGWPQSDTFNPKTDGHNVADAQLLGKRQMKFLTDWSSNKPKDAKFRALLSQSPWTCTSTLPPHIKNDSAVIFGGMPKPGEYPKGEVPRGDYDSNGWPQNRRNEALKLVAKAGAIHVNGDQHLGTTGQYGIEEYGDGPFWLSTPAIANIWPRRWFPKDKGANWQEGDARYTGNYIDGFGNKITMLGVNNPVDSPLEPARLHDRAVGYGIVIFDKKNNHTILENWSYWSGPSQAAPHNKPCADWPIVIDNATNKRVRK